VKLWRLETGASVAELKGHTQLITAVAFSPDGRYLVSASRDGSLRVWNTGGWDLAKTLEDEAPVTSVTLSYGGGLLAAGDEDGNVVVWKFPAGTERRILDVHSGATKSIAFSSDDRLIACAGEDRRISLVDVSSFKVIHAFKEQENPVNVVLFTPNDKHLIAGDQSGHISIYDVLARSLVQSFQSPSKVLAMGLSHDGHYLVTGHDNSTAYLWDLDQVQALRESRSLPADIVADAIFDDEGSLFPNKSIDAGESSRIMVTVINKGNGVAYDVRIRVACDATGLNFPSEVAVGDVPIGQSKMVEIPVQANLGVRESRITFRIQAREKRGYDARAISLDISGHELKAPALKIVSVEVNDKTAGLASGNGNGVIENGETIELSVLVRNEGVGEARDVQLNMESVTSGAEIIQAHDALGDIPVGKTMRGSVVFGIPRFFNQSAIRYTLKASEVRGVGTGERNESREVQNQLPILAFDVSSPQPTLTNGATSAISISISNTGKLRARNVDLSVSVSPSTVQVSVSRLKIGDIEPSGRSSPKIVEIALPRRFTEKSIVINLELTQQDFPRTADQRTFPVALLQPELKIIAETQRRIQQGESGFLEISVANVGRLTAEEVVATLRTNRLTIEGEKSRSFGRLSPNATSDPWRIRFRALRSVPAGPLPIEVELREREFTMSTTRLDYEIVEESALVSRVEPTKLERSISGSSPISDRPLILSSLADSQRVKTRTLDFRGSSSSERGIHYVVAKLNGAPIYDSRQQAATAEQLQRTRGKLLQFEFRIPDLRMGSNEIEITVYDKENEFTNKVFKISYEPEEIATKLALDPSIDVEDISRIRKGHRNADGVAIVIGIEKYQSLPSALFADRDANAIERYLIESFGFPPENIVSLLNEEGTLSNIRKELLGNRLAARVVAGKTDLFVFFSGHGFPNLTEKAMYIAPYDCDKKDIDQTGVSLNELFQKFKSLNPRSVTVILDACFSGYEKGRPDRFLLAAKPVSLVIESPELMMPGSMVFYSSSADQISSWIQEKKHSVFTYYLLRGLQGDADTDKNNEITVGELELYLAQKVPGEARKLGIEQTPQVRTSDKQKVVLKY
jgi:hypothetical protein